LKKLLLVAMLAILAALTGCGDANLPYLVSITVMPSDPSVAAGTTQQFTAQGTFSNKSTQDLTSLVTWSSSNLAVASIVAGPGATNSGLATTFTQGTSTITAVFTTNQLGSISGSTTLTVTAPVLTSIVVADVSDVIPGPNSVTATIATGTSHQFFAYGVYSDGGERDITTSVTWTSSPISVATISNVGRAAGIGVGTATITAMDPTTGIVGTGTLNVTSATVSSIVVSPTNQTIAPLTHLQFAAEGVFSDGTNQDITADVNWSSSNTAAATISNSPPDGLATGVAAGSATINATLGGVTGSAPLTVSSASLTSIAITPTSSSTSPVGVAVGSTLQLEAVGTFSDDSTQPINLAVAWSVSPNDGSIATVSATGLVTGVAAGTATVTAKLGAVTATAYLNVESVSSIAITPATATIAEGTQTQFVATATLADGSTQDISQSVDWVSADPSIATISDVFLSGGWASGLTPGTVTIGTVFGGEAATAQLTVTSATLSSIAITLPTSPANIALGTTQQYQATATFSDSSTQDLSNQVAWTSSTPAVAVVNGAGLATSTGTGTTTITATGNINGSTANATQALTVH
jgi:trimeric autotransporter adhesin